MEKSSLFNLNLKDVAKSLILTFITAGISGTYQVLVAKQPITLETVKVIGISSLTVTLGYLLKNYLTNSNDEFLKAEKK